MEGASLLHYLLDIVETKGLSSMAKLASLAILNKLFLKEMGTSLQLKCLQSDLTSSLVTMLDSGLNALNDPADTVCISVAMEILCQFSKLPICSIQCLVTDTVIRTLLDYLNSNGRFYRFPANTKMTLSEVSEGKQLMGKVKVITMSTEPLDYIHRHTNNKLKRVPDKIKVCRLINTESEEDLDVSQYLIQKQVAWPGCLPGEIVNNTDEWQNIIVTKVLDGGMFWAQVGEKTIKSVFEIQRQLNECTDHVRKPRALIGDNIVCYGEIMHSHCYIRAQVLAFDGCHIDMFAIDYGYTLRVSDRSIYILPEHLSTHAVKRKISLCSLDDISPPPYDEGLVHNAAAILVNLSKQSLTAGEILNKLDGIQIIKHCLENCPRPKLKAQVMTVLHNLSTNYRVSSEIAQGGFVKIVLDIVRGYIQSEVDNGMTPGNPATTPLHLANDDNLLLARCVLSLTNILHRNVDTRAQFYKHQGIDVILGLMIRVPKNDAVYCFCVKLLRVFIGRAAIKPEMANKGPSAMELLKEHIEAQTRKTIPTGSRVPTTTIPKFQDGDDSDSDQECENNGRHGRIGSSSPISAGMDRSQGYLLGETVNICDDEQHELCPQNRAKNIQVHSFAKHVCGMLNTGHGGTIYFGIDEDCRVFGLELSRDEKDRFRLGVDQHMFNKISPVLLHSQFNIKDIPVLDPNTGQVILDHYVIEICVRGSKGSIYTMADGACYYRFGSDTSAISRQELRQLIVLEEEASYSPQIQILLTLKQQLINSLRLDDS